MWTEVFTFIKSASPIVQAAICCGAILFCGIITPVALLDRRRFYPRLERLADIYIRRIEASTAAEEARVRREEATAAAAQAVIDRLHLLERLEAGGSKITGERRALPPGNPDPASPPVPPPPLPASRSGLPARLSDGSIPLKHRKRRNR